MSTEHVWSGDGAGDRLDGESSGTPAPSIGASSLPVLDDLESVVQLVEDHDHLFLRFSEGPEADQQSGNSRDFEADVELPGLSVTVVKPEPWWTRPVEDWVARRMCKYAELGEEEDRFPWLLTGRVVAFGPDHEPIVAETQPIARVGERALHQAKQRYQERFRVGQDSRSDS